MRYLIIFLFFILVDQAYAKNTLIVCELKKYYLQEHWMRDNKDIDLSKLDPDYLRKEEIVIDFDENKFISSTLFFERDFKKINIYETDVDFMPFKETETKNIFIPFATLNRNTGELIYRNSANKTLQRTDSNEFGWVNKRLYSCEKSSKKF